MSPEITAQAMTVTKNSVVLRSGGMPVIMPATRVTIPRSTTGMRSPAPNTSHAATKKTSAVAIAKPLKTARPTAAE